MKIVALILASLLEIIPCGMTFMDNLQQRDTARVGDRIRYGVRIDNPEPESVYVFPDSLSADGDTLAVLNGGRIDTLYAGSRPRRAARRDPEVEALQWSIVVAPFEEIRYQMPSVDVLRLRRDGHIDTLRFAARTLEVPRMQRDTSFVPDRIKPQVTYPVTFREVLSVALPVLLALALAAGVTVVSIIAVRRRRSRALGRRTPPYVVALSALDKYRGKEMWEPSKQKLFYSAITDIIRRYIDDSFGIDAPEMTTDELFEALGKDSRIDATLAAELQEVFRTADFVKFARFKASDEDCLKALPVAVRFVTGTYMVETEENAG